ncbi:MAG: peptidoglycan DD-metalloendopeptidase family protein [Bacteroidetes bacterium]|nr:peptidoglycan DD-metalloendopeptidase family protein [Bacteroidota bacterium]MBL7104567.1 peptidoglycan DD-metalloendopeptidase family protein [Bacteroidales bacterium]
MKGRRILDIIVLTALAFIIILIASVIESPSLEKKVQIPEEEDSPVLKYEYGIVVDSLLVFKDKVRKNQFLADILLSYGVDYIKIDQLAKGSKDVFDVRKIRAGNKYTVLCKNDSLKEVLYFIYENSPTSYVVFDIGDSVHIHKGEKEIDVKITTTSGTINSSLWNSMIENNTDPNLANELSEIYAWTIDFFGIQKGDSYKVICEELFVDNELIGIGKVQASWFQHAGHIFYAFYFVQDSVGDYFDDEANSMRRTFLKSPLRFKRISSRFSYSRMHPILKVRRPHLGVDYAAAYGTPVHAVGDGEVIFARRKSVNGNMIKIKHNGTYTTAYLHLSKFAKGIKKRVHVKQGDVIGYVGSTGRSTGPHLDFRFYRNGKPVDPLKVKSPPAKPVDSAYLADYKILIEKMKKQLDTIQIKK